HARHPPFPSTTLFRSFPLELHHMYTQSWNLSYQAQVGTDWLLSATYIGNGARHLRAAFERNPAVYIPGASTVANTAGFLSNAARSEEHTSELQSLRHL